MADHNYFANLIWQIADLLRGPYRPPQYERVMLPITVLRRFDCVLTPTKARVLAEHAKRKGGKLTDDALDRFLNKGGRLFLLLNYQSRTGLERLLSKWGVEFGTGVVVDEKESRSNSSVIIAKYGAHPVVGALSQARLPLQMILPRPILKRAGPQGADAPQVVELATSSEDGIAVNDVQNGVPRPNPATDPHGAIPVMIAVEKGSIKDVNLDRGSTRMIVTGDSYFLGNKLIEAAANRDFAWHAINWLLDRSQLLGGIGPRKITEYTLTVTQGQMTNMRWLVLAGIPGGVLLLGLLVWFRRRY